MTVVIDTLSKDKYEILEEEDNDIINNFHPITNKFTDGEGIGGIFSRLSTLAVAFESSSLGSVYDNHI